MKTASTRWETFLDAVIRAGFAISGTWPMRTERAGRMRDFDSNALASSIILVCRPRAADEPPATRREFVAALQRELPEALRHLQAGNIAPVDLAQAAIGPSMAVFTKYSKVLDAQGNALLYTLCERKKRAAEALAYNGLVQSWPEIVRLAQEGSREPVSTQGELAV